MERANEVDRNAHHQHRNDDDGGGGKERGDRLWINARFYVSLSPRPFPRAVKTSNERLRDAVLPHVAWGNTNAKTPDSKDALQAAEQATRRALLVRWGHELDRVSREELLVRNILRAMTTGPVHPCLVGAIGLATHRDVDGEFGARRDIEALGHGGLYDGCP